MGEDTQELLGRIQAILASNDDAALLGELAQARSEDVAEVFELLDDQERSRIIFAMPPRSAAEVIALLDEADRGEIVDDLNDEKLTELVSELPSDDAADVLGELPDERREEVLDHVPDEQAARIEELLEYDEDCAGGIMTTELIAVPAGATVREATRHVRDASEGEDLHEIYVVDSGNRLAGIVPLRRLVTNPKETPLTDICDRDPIAIGAHEDQEDVVRTFSKYDLAAVPVIDEGRRLVGRITHDDVMDVAEEEAVEDLYRMAGTDPAEMETTSPVRAARIRLTWLLPCMVGMTITAGVVISGRSGFHEAVYAAILAFAPMISAMGGNSGLQISTVIVRGLATGDLADTRIGVALFREGAIALIMAPVCGLVAAGICRVAVPVLQDIGDLELGVDSGRLSVAVGLGTTAAILIAGTLGIMLPFLFRRIGVDPAIASGPFVTTANDILSVSIYLILSIAILN